MSHGLRHAPKAIGWVVGWQPNSGSAVLPTVTTPAARKRAPRMVSAGARQSSDRSSPLPMYSGRPARQAPTSLSRERHAVERPARQRRIGGDGAPDVGQRHDDGVQHRVGGVDAGNRALRELGRRDLAVGDQIAQRDRVEPPQIVAVTAGAYARRAAGGRGAEVPLRPAIDVVVGDLAGEPLDAGARRSSASSSSASSIVPGDALDVERVARQRLAPSSSAAPANSLSTSTPAPSAASCAATYSLATRFMPSLERRHEADVGEPVEASSWSGRDAAVQVVDGHVAARAR